MRWLIAASVLCATPAWGAPRTAQLAYAGDACSSDDLVARVRELVGREPFAAAAATRVAITVTAGERRHASIAIFDGADELGRRELDAPTCAELTDAMALVIALILDRPVPDAPLPPPVPPAPPPSRVEPVTIAVPSRSFAVFAGVAASQEGTGAGTLGVRARRSAWSAELAFDLAMPESHAMVEVRRGGGAVAVCRHLGPVAVCPLASAGWISGHGLRVAMADTATTPLVSLGARLAAEYTISDRFSLRARVDGRFLVTSTAFTVDGVTVWDTPRAEGWLGIDLSARIP